MREVPRGQKFLIAENGCALSAGCWVHVSPERVWLGDRPGAGFPLDGTRWHTYRLLREEDLP